MKIKNLIIGFGKGGKTLANKFLKMGEEVVVIEKSEKMYGGTCINIGCIPSKSLIISSNKKSDFKRSIEIKNTLVTKLRVANYNKLTSINPNVVINGTAKFISDKVIEVTKPDGSKQKIEAQRIFINTGSVPFIPPIKGINTSKNCITSTQLMELEVKPKTLVIVGAGYISIEFAQAFANFGTKVIILETGERFLPREDNDISHEIKKDMANLGIEILTGIKINEVSDKEDKTKITIINGSETEITADKVLIATGRRPNTKDLGLENTKLEVLPNGGIKTNERLETNVEGVWAIGDVRGAEQFTYTSLDDYRIINNHLFEDKTRKLDDRYPLPYSVFITPQLSHVGMYEKDAITKEVDYKLFKSKVENFVMPKVKMDTRGLFKCIVDSKTNLILGATLYSDSSHELINLISLAIKANLPYTTIRDNIFTHPTMSENLNDLFEE